MSSEVDQIITNAINAEVKERYGEDTYVRQTIILVLTEKAPGPDDTPGTPRARMMLKTPQPIQPGTAARMLAEAATIFQRQKLEVDKNEKRDQL